MHPRYSGRTSASLFGLFVYALNGLVSHTMFPLRLATLLGFIMAFLCVAFALIQLTLKLIFWDKAPAGIPTLTIGLFFISGIQLFLIGFLGEFVGSIYKQSKGLPLVIEKVK